MFKEDLVKESKRLSEELIHFLPQVEGLESKLYESMHYSFLAGGKRLRPMILVETNRILGGKRGEALPFAAALEMIHTYSLIHDDLPAMDDDDYRRGKLTNHKVYGEAMAILAGDALLNWAFEVMSKACVENPCKDTVNAMYTISSCSGAKGMIGGQVVDTLSEGQEITMEALEYIHENKTSKLLQAATVAGAQLAGATDQVVEDFRQFAKGIGLAFQIQDDILDIESSFEELGKPINSDEKNEKQTYVSMMGMEEAKKQVAKLTEDALACISSYEDTDFLKSLAYFLTKRQY